MQKVLVLAPHTDDGELGCGATISKYIEQGNEVFYVAFSTCSQALPAHLPTNTLMQECSKATKALGITDSNIIFFDFEVRKLLFHRQQVLEELIKLDQQINPDVVFLPARQDIHQDHQVIYAEGLRAFKYSNVLGYELPWNNFNFQPNYFEKLSEAHLNKKITALKEYQTQAHRKYMDSDFIRSLSVVRGIQANSKYAEAFEVYHFTA